MSLATKDGGGAGVIDKADTNLDFSKLCEPFPSHGSLAQFLKGA